MFPVLPADSDFLKEIYYKKEYYGNKPNQQISCDVSSRQITEFQSHQKLIKNYINPNTPYKNLLVMWGTGVGKTLGAIAIAESFRPYIKQIRSKTNETPYIYIISSNEARNNFYKELFSEFIYPPYVTEKERNKLNALKISANSKNAFIKYKEFEKELINRVKQEGYYRFMGSVGFGNAVTGSSKGRKKSSNYIKNNNNGLIIVDEAHSMDDNDMIKAMNEIRQRSTNLKIILLTATPMINKAREIISMLNLLNNNEIKYSDVFEVGSNYDNLKPNGLQIIAKASRGYVSYMSGHNPYTFPKKIEIGEVIKPFKYTKLIPVKMSKFQNDTYAYAIHKKKVQISNIGGARGILDMVLPSPFTKDSGVGVFERADIEHMMTSASRDWLNDHNIVIKKRKGTDDRYITGGILKSPALKKYSTKFDKMLHDIIRTFYPENGPSLVYNDQITGIGLQLFGQILIENGIGKYNINKSSADNKENYGPDSICVMCAKVSTNHLPKSSHEFIPAKFIYMYGEIPPQERDKRITIINSMENSHGSIIKIVLGSRITAESIDFKRLRSIFITNFQDNISSVNQIIGRAIRHCSHVGLPDNQRNVEVYKYVSVISDKVSTIEIDRYLINEKKHENIIKIENVLKANAIDCSLNQTHCQWIPPKNVKSGDISTKTYDIYFYEDEILYNERQITRLFYDNIIWTYNELKKEVIGGKSLADEKYLAIALDRMIADKKVVINRFNDAGYIVYSPNTGAYLFQPLNNLDTTIPLLDRFISRRPIISQQVSIANYIDTLNVKQKEVFNLENVVEKINSTDDVYIYSQILSHLKLSHQQEVLEYGIIHDNRKILKFFKQFLLTKELLEGSGYSTSGDLVKKYVGHILTKSPRCLMSDNRTWSTCSKDVKKVINKIKENDVIIGFMDKQNNSMIFKLRPAQPKQKLDRRTIKKGFVCSQSSNKNVIIEISKKLGVNKGMTTSIRKICTEIENELRRREIRDKGRIKWFYEYIELL